jgi:hypothetical protein
MTVKHARMSGYGDTQRFCVTRGGSVFARAGFTVVERQQTPRFGQVLERALMNLKLSAPRDA